MKRILFVDDEKNILDGLRRLLYTTRDRWEMEFVTSGPEALLACERQPFDVVVSDLRMPGMNGAELLGEIRDRYPSTARLVLSGYSDVALAAKAVPVAYSVISKPCNAVEIKNAIDRVCALQDVLCSPKLREVVGRIGHLPSLSTTYISLTQALRDENTSVAAVVKIIEQDIAMSAKVLQVANCGFFGLPQRVSNLQHAVSYLGMDAIRTMALYAETFRIFVPDRRIPATLWPEIQGHALETACIAGSLPLSRETRDISVIGALLHDVGTLVLASSIPQEFSAVLATMKASNMSQSEAEEQVLGVSHAEVGAYLLGLWGINRLAVEAIAHHHRPTRISHDGLDCTVAVYLASVLAHELKGHPDDHDGELLRENTREDLTGLGILGQYPLFRASASEALMHFQIQ
jgi:HD-like signal output (HDOD) protein